MKKSAFFRVIFVAMLVMTTAVASPAPGQPAEQEELSAEEQTRRAQDVFRRILELTGEGERADAIPQMAAGYREIIEKYPRSATVHEAYWRLMLILMNDTQPPAFAEGEALFRDYFAQHPEKARLSAAAAALADGFYRAGLWNELLRFCRPVVKDFIETGALTRPNELFLYAEAKWHLNDAVEAAKGYRIVIAKFPNTPQAAQSARRLAELEKRMKP